MVIKWVDDFIFLHYPSHCLSNGSYEFTYSSSLVWSIAEELGWLWAAPKFVDFSTAFMYIDFWWDLSAKRVELLEKKKAKYLDQISTWTHGSPHTARESERVIGTLNHVCLVIPEGQAHLVSLYKFQGVFKADKSSEVKHRLTAGASEDMDWWRHQLQEEFVGIKIKRPPEPLNSKLYVDVSSGWGIGLILNSKWLVWQFKDGWKSEGRKISWAKMVVVELAVRTLIAGRFTGCHVIICSNNKGVVRALKAGRSWGTQQNAVLQEIVKLIQEHDLWISTTWIAMLENPADGPSRGIFPANSLLYAFPPMVPFHLKRFVHNTIEYHDSHI
jgi:hypothetical protein